MDPGQISILRITAVIGKKETPPFFLLNCEISDSVTKDLGYTEELLKVCFNKKGFSMQKLCVSMANTVVLGFQRAVSGRNEVWDFLITCCL